MLMVKAIARDFASALERQRAGEVDEAATLYEAVLDRDPRHAEALYLLGGIELRRGQLEPALRHLEIAASEAPNRPAFHVNLGEALRRSGRPRDAVVVLERAIALKPDLAQAHFNLGLTFESLGQREQAAQAFRAAIEAQPEFGDAYFWLGRLYWADLDVTSALALFRRGLEASADNAALHNGLAVALKDIGLLDEALDHLREALERKPDWSSAHGNLVYLLSFHPDFGDEAILEEARSWSARHAEPLVPRNVHHSNRCEPERRLKIGYVAPTFSEHVIGRLMVPILEHRDRDAFEVHCYADVERPDAITERLAKSADRWHDTSSLGDAELAEAVREEGIDLLVDLNMHMAGSRLGAFARRPAPVQLAWLAYPGTTGLSAMDYRISDRHLDPPELGPGPYTERTLTLPDSFWCFDPVLPTPDVAPLPAERHGFVTFGCLNNFCKVNDDVLILWAELLHRLPEARLRLLVPAEEARARVRHVLAVRGIRAERLTFEPVKRRAEYLATYAEIDIGLDTFPYNGHTTSLDAFYMGVPVVTLVGRTVAGRAGRCLASNLDLPELVASTPADYIEKALALAGDRDRLRTLRSALRARMAASPLMDAPRFTRNLEALYRAAWRSYCSG
jgi:protein O-GlcNAc transferase